MFIFSVLISCQDDLTGIDMALEEQNYFVFTFFRLVFLCIQYSYLTYSIVFNIICLCITILDMGMTVVFSDFILFRV